MFLIEEGFCRVHAGFGQDEKLAYCRTCPLQLVLLDQFAYLTVRRCWLGNIRQAGRTRFVSPTCSSIY